MSQRFWPLLFLLNPRAASAKVRGYIKQSVQPIQTSYMVSDLQKAP